MLSGCQLSGCQAVRLSGCQAFRLSGCPAFRLSCCQAIRMSSCQAVSLSRCQHVKLSVCQAVRLTGIQAVRLTGIQAVRLSAVRILSCQAVRMSRYQTVKLSGWQAVRLSAVRISSCQAVRMSRYQAVKLSSCQAVRLSGCQASSPHGSATESCWLTLGNTSVSFQVCGLDNYEGGGSTATTNRLFHNGFTMVISQALEIYLLRTEKCLHWSYHYWEFVCPIFYTEVFCPTLLWSTFNPIYSTSHTTIYYRPRLHRWPRYTRLVAPFINYLVTGPDWLSLLPSVAVYHSLMTSVMIFHACGQIFFTNIIFGLPLTETKPRNLLLNSPIGRISSAPWLHLKMIVMYNYIYVSSTKAFSYFMQVSNKSNQQLLSHNFWPSQMEHYRKHCKRLTRTLYIFILKTS